MIKCICVNDGGRPSKIPPTKWIVEGMEYHVVYATYIMPQGKIAVQLKEVNLDDSCAPYEYFLADRFTFTDNNLNELIYLIMDCSVSNLITKELLNETINERAADTN